MADETEDTSRPKPATDYTAPKAKKKRRPDEPVPEKNVEKVVTTEVIVKKRGIGTKIKNLFVEADLKSVVQYVTYDILIPAARSMIVEGAARGAERLIYGESVRRRGIGMQHGSRTTYNLPPDRGGRVELRDPRTNPPGRSSIPRRGRRDFFLQSREEADIILDAMFNLLSTYEVVSVHDLHELAGLPTSHVDQKWGWTDLKGVDVRPSRDGFYIDLPPEEPI